MSVAAFKSALSAVLLVAALHLVPFVALPSVGTADPAFIPALA